MNKPSLLKDKLLLIKNKLINKEWDKLVSELTNLEIDEQNHLFILFAYYKAYTGLKKYDLAENYIDKALLIVNDNPTLWRDKALCHQRRQEWKNALDCISKAIQIQQEIASYYASRAQIYLQLNDYVNSIKDYEEALKIDSSQISWLKSLAKVLVKNRDLDKAIDIYEKILKQEDNFYIKAIYNELKLQARTGKKEASSQYYNDIFSHSEKYKNDSEYSIYIHIWEHISMLLQENNFTKLIDLGCGPGQFAEFIKSKIPSIEYTGIDFSKSALEIARKRCPSFSFINKQLPLCNLQNITSFDVVICTEVLEHVEQDIEILKNISPETPVVFSVPNFDTFGHVRYFESVAEIENRYGHLFDEFSVRSFALSSQNTIWVIFGTRS